jgi:hypothetical protein
MLAGRKCNAAGDKGVEMFDRDNKDLAATLSWMEAQARERSNFNLVEAKDRMRQWVQNDRRFDSFDHTKLIDRVNQAKRYGAHLDLTDPDLQKGGQKRPLSR